MLTSIGMVAYFGMMIVVLRAPLHQMGHRDFSQEEDELTEAQKVVMFYLILQIISEVSTKETV